MKTLRPSLSGMKLPAEVESKILEIDVERCHSALMAAGANYLGAYELVAIWLSNNEEGEKLREVRVRQERKGVRIETKPKVAISGDTGAKACLERGVDVAETFEETVQFLETLGFSQISRNVKMRTEYLLSISGYQMEVVFDTYSDLDGMALPTLAEIEVKLAPENEIAPFGDDIEAITQHVYAMLVAVANIMGYDKSDLRDWNARQLSTYYRSL